MEQERPSVSTIELLVEYVGSKLAFCMGGKEVPTQNIWGTVSEISVTVDVCSGTVKYYILVRGTSEGETQAKV